LRCLYISKLKDPQRKEKLAREKIIKQYPYATEKDIATALKWRRAQKEVKKAYGLKVHYAIQEAILKNGWTDYINDLEDMNEDRGEVRIIQRHELENVLQENIWKTITIYYNHWTIDYNEWEQKVKNKILGKRVNCTITHDAKVIDGPLTFIEDMSDPLPTQNKYGDQTPPKKEITRLPSNGSEPINNKTIDAIIVNNMKYIISFDNDKTRYGRQQHKPVFRWTKQKVLIENFTYQESDRKKKEDEQCRNNFQEAIKVIEKSGRIDPLVKATLISTLNKPICSPEDLTIDWKSIVKIIAPQLDWFLSFLSINQKDRRSSLEELFLLYIGKTATKRKNSWDTLSTQSYTNAYVNPDIVEENINH